MDANTTSYETVAIIFPETEQDAISAMLHERQNLPDSHRKYFIGPLVGADGCRMYLLVHDGADNSFPMRLTIAEITKRARSYSKNITIVRVAFGGPSKQTRVIESTDGKIASDEDVNLRLKLTMLESSNNLLKSQLTEVQRLRDRDVVLAEALNDLECLRHQKELLHAIKEAEKELRTNRQLTSQSSERILSLLEKLQVNDKQKPAPEPNLWPSEAPTK